MIFLNKCILRVSKIIAILFLSSIFIYPTLHEMGHIIAIVLTGNRISDISIYPNLYVESMLINHINTSAFIIGLSGIVFPCIFALLFRSKENIVCLLRLSVEYISLIYILFFIYSLKKQYTFRIGTDVDVFTALYYCSVNVNTVIAYFIILILILAFDIVHTNPIKRILAYVYK